MVHGLEEMAAAMVAETELSRSESSDMSREVLPRLNAPVVKRCGKAVDIEDPAVPSACTVGLPIVMETPDSPFFTWGRPRTSAARIGSAR